LEDEKKFEDRKEIRKEEEEARAIKRAEQQKVKEEQAKLAEIEKKKKEEQEAAEKKILRCQTATLSVLRVLQKLSNASPDNFTDLKSELAAVLKTELPDTGAQQEILQAEADRVLEYAQQYVEQVSEQNKKLEEEKAEKMKKIQNASKFAMEIIEGLEELIRAAEMTSMAVMQSAQPLAGVVGKSNDEITKVTGAIEDAGRKAMVACSACADFISSKRPAIEFAPDQLKMKAKQVLSIAQPRIQTATMQTATEIRRATDIKKQMYTKMAAKNQMAKKASVFSKYDKDGDDCLNRDEVLAYAKGEFKFEIGPACLERVFNLLTKDEGIKQSEFHLLRSAVGIARHEAQDVEKKEKLAKRGDVVKEKKTSILDELNQAKIALDGLAEDIKIAEAAAEKLAKQGAALAVKELIEKTSAVQAGLEPTRKTLAVVKDQIKLILDQCDEFPELVELKGNIAGIGGRAQLYDMRFQKALMIASMGKQMALCKQFAEYEVVRMEVAVTLRSVMEATGGTADKLFDTICPNATDRIAKSDISEYLTTHNNTIQAANLNKLFDSAIVEKDDDAPGTIGRTDFERMVRVFYKVVKEIVLSDNLKIETSKQLRRMEIGEVLEVHEGPVLDASVKVFRVRGKTLRDGQTGWVTIAGNQGVTFLMPGGNMFKVVKPVPITAELENEDGQTPLRELRESEILEVLEWDRTSNTVTRIKAKVQGDGLQGWVTIGNGTGNVFLEAA